MPIQLTIQGQRLRVERPIGEGATSQVFLCVRESDGRLCALKVAKRVADQGRLAEEAERLLWARSDALVELLGVGQLKGATEQLGLPADSGALLLSWAEGETLRQYADARGKLEPRALLEIALGIALGLGDLHSAGIAHGDIKPSNVVVSESSEGLRLKVLDLGLGVAADSGMPRGGTRRYLAPELTDRSVEGDGRKRDLWALGLLLAELHEPRFCELEPREILRELGASRAGEAAVEPLLRALLAECPGARPTADWVVTRARAMLGRDEPRTQVLSRRIGKIQRAYLSVRRNELEALARRTTCTYKVEGLARQWLEGAVEHLRAIDSLRVKTRSETPLEATCVVDSLKGAQRLKFLVELIGPSAASWTIDEDSSDDALLSHLRLLVEREEPHAITLGQLGQPEAMDAQASQASPVELALLLWEGLPREDVLESSEAYCATGEAPLMFRLALGRKLRLLGQYGRALTVFDAANEPLLVAEAAETARRAGDGDGALARIASLGHVEDRQTLARCSATEARILLDRRQPEAAWARLEGAPETAALLEVRALVAFYTERKELAFASAERGLSLASGDEERARLESLLGMIYHAEQQPSRSVDAFRRAVESVSRVGAVLEEATYLTGLSAAAVDSSRIEEALVAAERATALFEVLGRPADAARAALNRLVALSSVGAVEQAKAAGSVALKLARQVKDERCYAYVHLALAEVLEGQHEGREHAELALRLLVAGAPEERLMAMAEAHASGLDVELETGDALARQLAQQPLPCLDWWGARARVALERVELSQAETIVGELGRLLECQAASSRRGRALAAGAALAQRVELGDAARRLRTTAAADAQSLIAGCPAELRPSVLALKWLGQLHMEAKSAILPEQIADIENLVRALGRSSELRPLLVQVLDALVLWTGVERGLLLLLAPGGRLVPRVGRNLSRSDLIGHQLSLSHSLAQKALEEGEPIVAVDASGELDSVHESVHALKLRSVLAVPLLVHGEAVGVVYLDDRMRRGAFGGKELAWVRLVGAVAAVAIADARDRLRLRRAARRAERAERRVEESLAVREAELGQARVELARRNDAVPTRYRYDDIVGNSQAMRVLLKLVDRVVVPDIPVLLLGESGTGKELIARAIHRNGPRARAEFVAENCGALPEPLLESALFGHVKGAFTGAVRARAGLFEVAHEGTLFLDEVGEMSLGMQTKLLRVLEEGEFWPVGAERPKRVNVRVVAATHRDLEAMVRAGTFRQDLFYRLHVLGLRVPPLRERYGDIPLLVEHFLGRYASGRELSVTREALELLGRHPWPGNVRQLENELRRAIVMSDSVLGIESFSEEVGRVALESRGQPVGLHLRAHLDRMERELVTTALERTRGNQTKAAELLGLSRFGLQKMLRRLGVSVHEPSGEPTGQGSVGKSFGTLP